MLIVAVFRPFQTTTVVISGARRGAGDSLFVAPVMMLCVTVIRPLRAAPIDMITRMTLVFKRFNGGKWHAIQV